MELLSRLHLRRFFHRIEETEPAMPQTTNQNIYEQLVDTLETLFGKHPGYRPMNAKGTVCEGTFIPAETARALSRAAHLQGGTVPITVRFSDFTGIPPIPDGDPNASPRGIGIRFHLENGASTDLVAHSYDGFPVATAEEFLAFLRALAASGSDATKPTSMETFLANHPRAKQFVDAPKPAPASFASESYYAVNTFRFTNQSGTSRYGRYQIHPVAAEEFLSAKQAAELPSNFLFDEIVERFKRSPVQFRIVVQLAANGDSITDASQRWPVERARVELGTLSVIRTVADSDAQQRSLGFDPTRLVGGIEPSNDPLIKARSEIYAISYRRRNSTVE
jgi:catalase